MLIQKQTGKETQARYRTIKKIHKLVRIVMKLLLVAAIVVWTHIRKNPYG
jgi:hypothetical protein